MVVLTKEQEAELKSIIGSEVKDRIQEAMGRPVEEQVKDALGKLVDRKFITGGDLPPKTGEFKDFREFLRIAKNDPYNAKVKVLSEGTDSQGGFLVPEQFYNNLYQKSLEVSVVRPFATVVPMASDTFNWPAVDETSHASHLYGGIVAYWTEEAAAKTASYPIFRHIKLIAKKLIGFVPCPDELLQDSVVSMEPLLTKMFGGGIGWYEDLAFLRGTGVGQPLGIFGSGALIVVPRATVNTISLADLANIMARMYPDSLYAPSTIWILSPACLAQLIPLVSTAIAWLPLLTGAASRIPGTILGMPFMVSEKVPTLGVQGDIGLYDISHYLIGDRSDIRVDSSIHYRFNTDETTWRFVKRVDGHAMVDSAFTPYNGGATLSPFVQLSSATSG